MNRTIHPVKRFFDIVVCILLAPPALIFICSASLALFLEHLLRGHIHDGIFYSETRVSAGEKFKLYKFNIFSAGIIAQMQSSHTFIHTKDLERNGSLSFVGWCLKQTYLDELPQLWCVMKGDMSIVGPRPVNTEVYERFMREGYREKSLVRAGLTGPFQSLKDDQTASAHKLDQWYADYVTTHPWYAIIGNDLRIIVRTMRVVLKAKGI